MGRACTVRVSDFAKERIGLVSFQWERREKRNHFDVGFTRNCHEELQRAHGSLVVINLYGWKMLGRCNCLLKLKLKLKLFHSIFHIKLIGQ